MVSHLRATQATCPLNVGVQQGEAPLIRHFYLVKIRYQVEGQELCGVNVNLSTKNVQS